MALTEPSHAIDFISRKSFKADAFEAQAHHADDSWLKRNNPYSALSHDRQMRAHRGTWSFDPELSTVHITIPQHTYNDTSTSPKKKKTKALEQAKLNDITIFTLELVLDSSRIGAHDRLKWTSYTSQRFKSIDGDSDNLYYDYSLESFMPIQPDIHHYDVRDFRPFRFSRVERYCKGQL